MKCRRLALGAPRRKRATTRGPTPSLTRYPAGTTIMI